MERSLPKTVYDCILSSIFIYIYYIYNIYHIYLYTYTVQIVYKLTKKETQPHQPYNLTLHTAYLVGSTSLWEANPRAMEIALRLHDATIRQVLAKHSGYEAKSWPRGPKVQWSGGW